MASRFAIPGKNLSQEVKGVCVNMIALCLFAAGALFVRVCTLDPISVGFYRMFFCAIILIPFVCRKWSQLAAKDIGMMLLSGLLLGIDVAFSNMAIIYTTIANVSLLSNTHIFLVMPLSCFFLRERISKRFFFGVVVAFVGVILLVNGKEIPSIVNLRGDIYSLLSAAFYSGYFLTVFQARKHVDSLNVIFFSSLGCIAVLFPAMLIFEGFQAPQTLSDLLPILGILAFSQFGGIGLLSYCLGKIRPHISSLLSLSQPAIAALMGYLFFSEILTVTEIIGIIVVSGGIYIAQSRNQSKSNDNQPGKDTAIDSADEAPPAAIAAEKEEKGPEALRTTI